MEGEVSEIPDACQFAALNLKDDKRVKDERLDWLPKDNKIPVWSRLLENNCVGHSRDMSFNKKGKYEIEIPSRLWSLWGNLTEVPAPNANQFAEIYQYESVCCVLALCSALKLNLNDWSTELLDSICTQGFKFYQDLLTKLNLNNVNFQKKDLNTSYQFQKTLFKVTLEQVATGYVYIPYGYNEYNIARAITYFFNNYQFGLICCNSKTIAVGYCVDIDDGYFMFDCQSRGDPLFPNNNTAAYILRCNHLQILLYCIVVTLNVSKLNTHFIIYNVDINIDDTVVLTPKMKPWKKLTTNLTFKKDPQKSQTPQTSKPKRETLQKIKNSLSLGVSGPTTVKVSSKNPEKEKEKQKEKEKDKEKDKDKEKVDGKVTKMKKLEKDKEERREVKQTSDSKKKESTSVSNNKENNTKFNVLSNTQSQIGKEPKKLTKSRSFHEVPMTRNIHNSLKLNTNKTERKGFDGIRNSTRSTSEGGRKVYLVQNKSKPQAAPIKTVNPKIIVVNQLSELMDK